MCPRLHVWLVFCTETAINIFSFMTAANTLPAERGEQHVLHDPICFMSRKQDVSKYYEFVYYWFMF